MVVDNLLENLVCRQNQHEYRINEESLISENLAEIKRNKIFNYQEQKSAKHLHDIKDKKYNSTY
jgi:hypothetical protein